MSLRTKTTALLSLVILSALVTACLLLLHYEEQALKRTIFEGIDGQAEIAAHGIESFIDVGRRESKIISVRMPLAALAQGNTGALETYLKQMSEVFPDFQDGISIIDSKGNLIVDYPPHAELRGDSMASVEYFERTIREGKGIVSKPYRSRLNGLPVLTFTAPIHDANGATVGVLACSINLLSHEALGGYREEKFGDTGYLYVFDRSRLLILHPDNERLLTHVEAGRNRVLEAALKGFEGHGETVNSQGVPMLLSVHQLPNVDWTVAVQVPQKEAYAAITKARRLVIGILAIAILLSIAVSVFAIRHITQPLRQLEQATSQIGSELDEMERSTLYELPSSVLESLKQIRSGDEIGLLASSFLLVATKLSLALGSLRRSVDDWNRTFNSVHEAVLTLDREGRIVRMNLTAERWFKKSFREVRGEYCDRVIFGVRPKEWPGIDRLAEQQHVRWSQTLEEPRGTFEFSIAPLTSSDGTTGAVMVINDITQRVESEEHIRGIAKAFQIADRTLNTLLKGFFNEETPLEMAKIILEETGVGAVAITDTEKILAFVGFGSDHHIPGEAIASDMTREAISKNQVVFADGVHDLYQCNLVGDCPLGSVLVVPLYVGQEVIGAIKLYEPKNKRFLKINKSLGQGITRLLSNQLLLFRYEQQKNLLVMSELKLIHAQINPHFLFNTLNTIIAIIRKDSARARDLLIDLSTFFRKNLKRSGDLSSLQEELDHVNSYLQIEKARFEDRLVVRLDIDPTLLNIMLPTFTLQPLIENSIKHGISQMAEPGVATIRAYRSNGFAIIEIEDNAGSFSEAKQDAEGLGIKLVDKRIKNLVGNEFGISVYCLPDEVTRVTIRMPLEGCVQ